MTMDDLLVVLPSSILMGDMPGLLFDSSQLVMPFFRGNMTARIGVSLDTTFFFFPGGILHWTFLIGVGYNDLGRAYGREG